MLLVAGPGNAEGAGVSDFGVDVDSAQQLIQQADAAIAWLFAYRAALIAGRQIPKGRRSPLAAAALQRGKPERRAGH